MRDQAQTVREEEHSVDDLPAGKVEQPHRPELISQCPAPVFQHLSHRHVVCYGEHEIEVRPPVSFVVREGSKGRPGYDTGVMRRRVQHQVPNAVAVAEIEHDPILDPARRQRQDAAPMST